MRVTSRDRRDPRRRRAPLMVATMVVALGLPASPVAQADGNEVPGATPVARGITVGDAQACSIRPGGTVRCWTPVAGDLPLTVPLGTGRTATALSAGQFHTCALLDNATVKCWGRNSAGQLGQGDNLDRPSTSTGSMGDSLDPIDLGTGRTATAIAAGSNHTCAILDTGAVKCWGMNAQGQLGLGGVWDGQMGDALPTVSLGTGRTAVTIAAGEQQTCVILDNASVKCWGLSSLLGIGEGHNSIADRGDEPGDMGDNLPTVALGTGRTATAISVGRLHTCVIVDNGSVKCWGANWNGALGLGDDGDRGDEPGEMGDNLPAVALGTGRTAATITAGELHSCALLDDGAVKCWGVNDAGQLGLGDTNHRGDVPGEMGDSLPAVNVGAGRSTVAVTAGGNRSCVLRDDSSIRCWGRHEFLVLGDSFAPARLNAVALGDVPEETGDGLRPIDFGAAAPPGGFRVDAEVRRDDRTTYVGNDVYNATAAGQSMTRSARPGSLVTFVVRITNESSATDSFQFSGPVESIWAWPGPHDAVRRFRVRYLNGITDVTVKVGAGTFRFRNVSPGATRTLKVQLITENGSPSRNGFAARIRVRSVGDADTVDAVKPKIQVNRS